MPERIPTDKLYHATVVVRDLKRAARGYAEVYGIDQWRVVNHDAERLRDASAFGSIAPYSYTSATGSNANGVTFRLVQPTGGMSTFNNDLITRGEGIHGFCSASMTESAFDTLRYWLNNEGVHVAQQETDDAASRYYFDTRAALGGYYVEVVVPHTDAWQDAADETWDFAGEFKRPAGVEDVQNIPKIGHFGIAVTSLVDRLPHYARLLGLEKWRGVDFSMASGMMDELLYKGESVDHAWVLAISQVADFGLELIQPTKGPVHYRTDYLDVRGEGIHHMLLLPGLAKERISDVDNWMTSLGAPPILNGFVRNRSAAFWYWDTRDKLGGYVFEAICDLPAARPRGGIGSTSAAKQTW